MRCLPGDPEARLLVPDSGGWPWRRALVHAWGLWSLDDHLPPSEPSPLSLLRTSRRVRTPQGQQPSHSRAWASRHALLPYLGFRVSPTGCVTQ
jgi:hypothetical protein